MLWRADRVEPVTPDEQLARCLTQSNHYKRDPLRVTERAFLPAPDGATSVFRIDGLDDKALWGHVDVHVGSTGRRVEGAGIVLAQVVKNVGLRMRADDVPPRHAEIVGWPDEKSDQKSRAQQLAGAAVLKMRPGK